MRWIVAGLLVLAAAWGTYVVSPYYALYRLGRAVEAGDAVSVAARVNARAVRYSVARQVAAEFTALEPSVGIATADAQLAAAAALAFADPLVETIGHPEGLIRLLRTAPSEDAGGTAFGSRSVGIEDLDDFLSASRWRGFRTVYVFLPPSEVRDSRFRLQLRFGGGRWRLVSLEMPQRLVRRVATDLKQRQRR